MYSLLPGPFYQIFLTPFIKLFLDMRAIIPPSLMETCEDEIVLFHPHSFLTLNMPAEEGVL